MSIGWPSPIRQSWPTEQQSEVGQTGWVDNVRKFDFTFRYKSSGNHNKHSHQYNAYNHNDETPALGTRSDASCQDSTAVRNRKPGQVTMGTAQPYQPADKLELGHTNYGVDVGCQHEPWTLASNAGSCVDKHSPVPQYG